MSKDDMAAQGPLDRGVREQAVENMAVQIARSKDSVIAGAITSAIGDGWALASLTGRLESKIYPDGVEVVALDGKDILELHPMRFEQVTEGGSIKIKAVQDYRVLRPNLEVSGLEKRSEATASTGRARP